MHCLVLDTEHMRMTEAFATTVAAVAPVIWLVGALEMHQISKWLFERSREDEEPIALARAYLEQIGEVATVTQLKHLVQLTASAAAHRPRHKRGDRSKIFANFVWGLVVSSLFAAELVALRWLGSSEQEPDGPAAWSCFAALLFGFAVVSWFPVVIFLGQSLQSLRRRRQHVEELSHRTRPLADNLKARAEGLRGRLEHAEETEEEVAELARLLKELRGESES